MKDGRVKDAAQDVAQDVTKSVAEDVLGRRGGRKRKGVNGGARHLPAAKPTPSTRMPPPKLPVEDT